MNDETKSGDVKPWITMTAIIHVIATMGFLYFFLGILPRFEKIFKDFDADLPGSTILTLDIGNMIVRLWYLAIPLLAAELAVLGVMRRESPGAANWLRWLIALALVSVVGFGIITIMLPLIGLQQKMP